MLDYTKAAVKHTVEHIKKLDYARNIATQLLYIAYLVYTLIAKVGSQIANGILLALSVAYLIFFLYVTKVKTEKSLKRTGKSIYKHAKRLVKLFNLGVAVYGICITAKHVTPLALLFVAFMIVAWVLQIVFEVLLRAIAKKAQFILEGLEEDYKQLTKPVKTVGNFFKKITGKEVQEEAPLSENVVILQEEVQKEKERKRAEKQAKKKKIKQ